jgi:MFS family permease
VNLNTLGRALAHRNFRLFFLGQGVSLVGTWMQQVALQWLVYTLTNRSAYWLGLVGFSGQAPALFLAPVAGVLVDRWNRHRLVVVTQTLAMLQAFAVAVLALTGVVTPAQIIVLSLLLGVINVFDMTGRQAFLTDMVERREDLANAIALNSSMVNAARLVGPALAGLVLAQTSAGVCFLFNGLSYLAVLAALLAMRVQPRPLPARRRLAEGLREGLAYVFRFPPIRDVLLLLALVSLAGTSYGVLLPVFATEILGGRAGTLGLLGSAAGVGALAGAVFLAARPTVLGLGKWIALCPVLMGLALMAFSFSDRLLPSLLLLALAGFAMMVQMAASNTLLQTLVEEDKRGRVMSLYTLAFLGMVPLGSLLAGALASAVGAPAAVRLGAACCTAGGLLFAARLPALRALVRPIYVRMGILPEVAAGIQAATELAVPPEQR